MSDDNADNDSDDNGDTERPQVEFQHIQRLSGDRFLRVVTEETVILVRIYRDDLQKIKEQLDEPPTVI